MTIKELKSLLGLFTVTLSLVLLYSFTNTEQVEGENVYSSETTVSTEIVNEIDGEQKANAVVSEESEVSLDEELVSGVVQTGLLTNRMAEHLMNYEVSSVKQIYCEFILKISAGPFGLCTLFVVNYMRKDDAYVR